MAHELTFQEIEAFHQEYANSRNQVVARAAERSGILEASFNPEVVNRLNDVFSLELHTDEEVTNQKQSGRCWLFSAINFLRHDFEKKHQVKNFKLSQAYNFFWDKIERANIFYNAMIKLADKPLTDRTVQAHLEYITYDGGQWALATSLVQKYGVMPATAMPESFNSNHTDALVDVLARKERKDALKLRSLVQKGQLAEAEKAEKQFLSEVYRIMALALGEPPRTFDLEFRDATKDKKLHYEKDLTPVEFFHKYWDVDFDDFIVLTNAPDHEYNKVFSLPFQNNVAAGLPTAYLNVPMEHLTKAAIKQLQAGDSVWFGNDVGKEMERKSGYLDPHLYETDALFDIDTQMSKGDRLATGEAHITHAMTLVGVDLDGDQPRKWKVENSWGHEIGRKGYFTMSNDWFENYVYEVVIKKENLTPDLIKLAQQEPIPLPAWDSLS